MEQLPHYFRKVTAFLSLVCLGLGASALSHTAQAGDFYGRLDLGLSMPSISSKTKDSVIIGNQTNSWGDQNFTFSSRSVKLEGSLTADKSLAAGVAIGYNLYRELGLEFNAQYRGFNINSTQTTSSTGFGQYVTTRATSSVTNLAFLPKARLAVEAFDNFRLIASAGLGLGLNLTGDVTTTIQGQAAKTTARATSKTDLVWGAGLGFGYDFTDKLSLGVALDYTDLGEATWVNYLYADPTVTLKATDIGFHATLKF